MSKVELANLNECLPDGFTMGKAEDGWWYYLCPDVCSIQTGFGTWQEAFQHAAASLEDDGVLARIRSMKISLPA